jgi:hypothetical protein
LVRYNRQYKIYHFRVFPLRAAVAAICSDGPIGGVAVLQSQQKSLEETFGLCLDFGPFHYGFINEGSA